LIEEIFLETFVLILFLSRTLVQLHIIDDFLQTFHIYNEFIVYKNRSLILILVIFLFNLFVFRNFILNFLFFLFFFFYFFFLLVKFDLRLLLYILFLFFFDFLRYFLFNLLLNLFFRFFFNNCLDNLAFI